MYLWKTRWLPTSTEKWYKASWPYVCIPRLSVPLEEVNMFFPNLFRWESIGTSIYSGSSIFITEGLTHQAQRTESLATCSCRHGYTVSTEPSRPSPLQNPGRKTLDKTLGARNLPKTGWVTVTGWGLRRHTSVTHSLHGLLLDVFSSLKFGLSEKKKHQKQSHPKKKKTPLPMALGVKLHFLFIPVDLQGHVTGLAFACAPAHLEGLVAKGYGEPGSLGF